jgi:hypothetical protein
MRFKVMLFSFLLLMLPARSFAGGASCSTATALIPDGRLLALDYVQPGGTAWYQFSATANRSYSVEVRDDLDPDNADFTPANGGGVLFYAAPVSCTTPVSSTNYTDTHLTEPVAGPHATRFSIVPTVTGAYYLSVQNGSSTIGHYVTVAVTETTLYGELWTTGGGLATQFQFVSTTSQNVSCTLTLTATVGGTETKSVTQTIGPNSTPYPFTFSTGTGAGAGYLGMNTRESGFAVLTHNGPPGAIQADAYWSNWGTTPVTVIPMPFGPMRGK